MKPETMTDPDSKKSGAPRVFLYRGTLPPVLGLLLIAPLLFVFLSVAAVALAGGTLAAVFLPLLLRRRHNPGRDAECITLDRDQYTRIDRDRPQLPR
jgi:hypothetical protein